MKEKRVLFVSIAFPPKKDPECIQTAKYVKYLVRSDRLVLEVVTSGKTLFMPYDEEMEPYTFGIDHRLQLPIYENKYLNFLIRKVNPRLLEKPDSKYSFHLQWKRVLKSISQKPDVIYSRSFPLSSTYMALKLKKILGVPWVMHLSDPWTLSPIHSMRDDAYQNRLELECFQSADKICFTTMQTIDLYAEKYPQWIKKFEWFPNVYDKDDLIAEEMNLVDQLHIVYTGGLVGLRNPGFFLQVYKNLLRERPELEGLIKITFAGQTDRQSRAILDKYSNLQGVNYLGEVSMEKARKLQNSAQILLLIDNPIKDSREAVFLPSKLLDYLLAKKRIMAISTKNGATSSALTGLNCDFIEHFDVEQLKSAILNSLKEFSGGNMAFFRNQVLPSRYDAAHNAERLEQLLYELC